MADILFDAKNWYLKQLYLENLNGSDLTERQTRRLTAETVRQTLREWTEFSETDINTAVYDENRDRNLPEIMQAIGTLAQKWLANDLVPPPVTAKEISRQTGFSPQRITGIISNFAPTVDGFGRKYRLELSDEENKLPLKKAIKQSRYESRPPGGGPVQRARFQKRRLPAQLERLAQERKRIEFFPVDSQPEFLENGDIQRLNLQRSGVEFVDPDIVEVIQYLKKRSGKGWLGGTNETGLAETLSRLSAGELTDLPLWNCFEFDWKRKRADKYPACTIEDNVDTSIVSYNLDKVKEALEWFSLLGPVCPIVLVPTNETNAPAWSYIQTPAEREKLVNSVVDKLRQEINGKSGLPIEVMRWDDYLVSRGIKTLPAEFSRRGAELIIRTVTSKKRAEMIWDEQKYFEQFGITVSERELEKRVPYYYGVYVGEGQAFAEIAQSGRNVILLDLEEFHVGKMTALGTDEVVPIVSPLSRAEKLDYYKWKKSVIQTRKLKI